MISMTDWWAGLANYNQTFFPLQFIVIGIAFILILFMLIKPSTLSSNLMKIFLGCSMIFNGVAFFILLEKNLPSPLKYFQGGLFIVIGLFFFIDLFKQWSFLQFPPKEIRRSISFIALIMVALYPIIGLLLGRNIDQFIYPATIPCASTAFAFVILSASCCYL